MAASDMKRLPIKSDGDDIGRVDENLQSLVPKIRDCTLCAHELDRPPNPILQVSETARILIAGQAPGNLADKLGQPFKDPSGKRLRSWMGISEETFYNAEHVAIVPMGFCFPGYDAKGGDKPPIKRCAATWRSALLAQLPNTELTLLIGRYALNWHMPETRRSSLTDVVKNWPKHLKSGALPLPHPSWRNNRWIRRNDWFERDLIPQLQERIRSLLHR